MTHSRKSKAKPPAATRSRSSTYVNDHGDEFDRPTTRRASASYSVKPALSTGTASPKIELWSPPLSPMLEIKAYASLPSSPKLSSAALVATPLTSVKEQPARRSETPPFSLWEYLREELLATDFDSHQELKWERVSNFLSIPIGVEKILSFGFILCFDTFLHTFTILPIRAMLATFRAFVSTLSPFRPPVPAAQKADILRMLLLLISVAILTPLTDASQIYHSIRGQDTIKLYVIFNALEIADRLLTSIGQDILDCLFSRSTLLLLSNHVAPSTRTLKPLLFFILAVIYTVVHAIVLVYQLTALNVAINAYDNSLLTLLLSNQFVEIKGSVFKKFEKDNLFQITCADIVERFQLALMLVSIAIRNLIELSSAEMDLSSETTYVLPVAYKAFRFISGKNIMWSILAPVLTVLASELVVDWLKHAFITKFNHIRPSVYERYIDVLCRDLTTGSWVGKRQIVRKHHYVDQSPVVARRLGFAALPMAVLSIIICYQSLSLVVSTHFADSSWAQLHNLYDLEFISALDWVHMGKWVVLGILTWFCLVTVKLMMGVNLLAYASRRRDGMEQRMREDEAINDFTRAPIGEGKEETAYNRELKTLLSQARDDVPPTAEIGENRPNNDGTTVKAEKASGGGGGGGKKKVPLEDLTRFTMVKRIW
ncbi:hypothetical protein FRB96_005508 [Tulasnella sp. 330]|nr:hypothetical protein FRB96_005508 [Tulasnella sp. 330]KAG8874314.1 hypothetical protein FRB97_005982 [Tulasnella sp. 331]